MTAAVRVYCYVRLGNARVAGFPALVDPANAITSTQELRRMLAAAINEQGRSVHAHGHLYRLEVRDFDTDNHICDVEASP